MFAIANRNNEVFGIDGYNIVKKYVDPEEQVRQRKYLEQKKGQKDPRYVTRRGSYLDRIERVNTKIYPRATHYNVGINWPDANPKNHKKIHETKRNTFIDDINNPVNVKKVPGVGKYNVLPTEEQIKEINKKLKAKKIKEGERDNIFCNYEY
jgi:hypothetical protein